MVTWSESAESNPAIDALERELRAATDANDATRLRLSRDSSSSSSDVVAVADADARLRAAADQLIAQQARAEAIASEKATLAFRLESAREEIRAGGGGLLNLGTARGAGRRRSAAMDDDGRRWPSTMDDDANDDGTGREQARAPNSWRTRWRRRRLVAIDDWRGTWRTRGALWTTRRWRFCRRGRGTRGRAPR